MQALLAAAVNPTAGLIEQSPTEHFPPLADVSGLTAVIANEAALIDVHVDSPKPSKGSAVVRFEQTDASLTALEITLDRRAPVMASLHRALFALGIIVSSYQVRTHAAGFTERLVIEREDGGDIQGHLILAAKAVILPIALQGAHRQIASV